MLRNTELIGVLPPVARLSLLRPYPPNAGSPVKQAPTRLDAPSATSSRLALSSMPVTTPAVADPRLLAATELSKKPSSAMRNEVGSECRINFIFARQNGH